jgi:hypothetical protein
MLKTMLNYTGRVWLNKIDSLVGKTRNNRYFRKFRLIEDGKFHTLTVFANKASDLFTLPETLVVYNLPVQASEYKHNEQTYVVYSTEYDKLIQHMKRE